MGNIDWRLVVQLFSPASSYGWLAPADQPDNLLGEYEWIDWRDSAIPKPTKAELESIWSEYESGEINRIRQEAIITLNEWRGAMRSAAGLTSAAFQELVYTGKMLEARRFLDGLTTVCYFSKEAAARRISELEMAQLIVSQGEAWLAASDQIEAAYVSYLATVEEAQGETGEAEIQAVLDSLEWP